MLAFEDKTKAFEKMLKQEKPMYSPSHSTPVNDGQNRVHASYTLRSDVVEKVKELANQEGISRSNLVEKILSKSLL